METKCKLCPAECGADRSHECGACGADNTVRVAKYGLHPFEEPCISGKKGSGTVFFSGCALRCVFCQNHEISRANTGEPCDTKALVRIFRELEDMGAENINLVTASHYVPQLLQAFKEYRPKIPVVYNTHSYEKIEVLQALDKYIDIYLPDMKYYSPKISARYTGKANYFEYASRAVEFMARRECEFDGEKMMRGCIVRHLILPLCTDDSLKIVQWLASLHSPAYFSLMGQYTPCGDIENFPELKRRITPREYRKVRDFVFSCGIEHLFLQKLEAADSRFIPDFSADTNTLF